MKTQTQFASKRLLRGMNCYTPQCLGSLLEPLSAPPKSLFVPQTPPPPYELLRNAQRFYVPPLRSGRRLNDAITPILVLPHPERTVGRVRPPYWPSFRVSRPAAQRNTNTTKQDTFQCLLFFFSSGE